MNPTILGDIGTGFLNQVPTLLDQDSWAHPCTASGSAPTGFSKYGARAKLMVH